MSNINILANAKCINVADSISLHICSWMLCQKPIIKKRARFYCSDKCRDNFYDNHLWDFARIKAMKRANNKCMKCGAKAEEVNHIERLNGGKRTFTCLNHQDNLEALCRACHRIITNQQLKKKKLYEKPSFTIEEFMPLFAKKNDL